jgi:Tfp pilus assembly protein PilO
MTSVRATFGRVLLFAAVFVAGYLALGWGVDRLVGDRLARAENDLARLERDLRDTEAAAGRLSDFEAEVKRGEQELAELRAILPDDSGLAGLEQAIRGAAARTGVETVEVVVGRERALDFYAVLPVEVTVRGGDSALAEFLSRLGGQPRLMRLQSLHAERHGERLTVRLGLEAYSVLSS